MTIPSPEEFTHHHKWLQCAFLQQPDQIGTISLQLWESLARELIRIIGEAGFEALYSRCVYLLRDDFPWLQIEVTSTHIGTRFELLCTALEQQEPDLAELASRRLFDTFIRLLSRLIGVGLTRNILQGAWGMCIPELEQRTDDKTPHNDSIS